MISGIHDPQLDRRPTAQGPLMGCPPIEFSSIVQLQRKNGVCARHRCTPGDKWWSSSGRVEVWWEAELWCCSAGDVRGIAHCCGCGWGCASTYSVYACSYIVLNGRIDPISPPFTRPDTASFFKAPGEGVALGVAAVNITCNAPV
jgi:hypothetical protein